MNNLLSLQRTNYLCEYEITLISDILYNKVLYKN